MNSSSIQNKQIEIILFIPCRTRINELRNLQYLPRFSEARETMFEDRTKAHADHVGHGHERMTTAAVGKFRLKEDNSQ